MGVGQPLLQTLGLDRQDLLTALVPLSLLRWHKGPGGKASGKNRLREFQGKGDSGQDPLLGVLEGGVPAPLPDQAFQIDLRSQDPSLEPGCLRQYRTVLSDDVVAAEYQVCVDSPSPALAYTYPQISRADCPSIRLLR